MMIDLMNPLLQVLLKIADLKSVEAYQLRSIHGQQAELYTPKVLVMTSQGSHE